MKSKALRLFALCYAAALAIWLAVGTFALARHFYYSGNLGASAALTLDDLQLVSLKPYESFDYQEDGWLVSTDSDPQMLWQGDAYVETVDLYIHHESPANGVELYYLLPGQTDYSLRQVVYAQPIEGGYRFDVGGKKVSGLRFDTDSVGGVVTSFEGIQLNPSVPLWKLFVPGPRALLLLLCLPALAAALLAQLGQWKRAVKQGA